MSHRSFFLFTLSLLSLRVPCVVAQASRTSDPQALAYAAQSIAALTGGATINDLSLNANVILFVGPDRMTGTARLFALGIGASRVDLSLGSTTLTEVRTFANGSPMGAWAENGAKSTPFAQHNSWTDAVWFFPALSSLTQTANPIFVFKYIAQEQYAGIAVQHIQVSQAPAVGAATVQRLTLTDFYLDAKSFLPVVLKFKTHADNDMNIDIPIEIRFAGYQTVQGVLVPFQIQRLMSNGLALDITVTGATINSGLQSSLFTLP